MNRQNEGKIDAALHVLRSYIGYMTPDLHPFLNDVLKEFGDYPGGSSHHHGYRYGLVIHTAEVTRIARVMAQNMGANLAAVTVAAIMHDWGKIYDYEFGSIFKLGQPPGDAERTPDYSVVNKRPGFQKAAHIIASYDRWNSIRTYYDENGTASIWPTDKKDFVTAVGRCILSHHGQLEWGSILTPSSPEEWCLHLADMASANAGVVL